MFTCVSVFWLQRFFTNKMGIINFPRTAYLDDIGVNDEKKNEAKELIETTTGSQPELLKMFSHVSVRESPVAVLSSTVPTDLQDLLSEAIDMCNKYERNDIINTYVCNLRTNPKYQDDIANGLQHIAHLHMDNVNRSMFVPIRY